MLASLALLGWMTLRSGKYRGYSYAYVEESDRKYCGFLLNAINMQPLPHDLATFARHLKCKYGGFMDIGRLKGMWFTEIWDKHPDYVSWVAGLPGPWHRMKDLQEYARERDWADRTNGDALEKHPCCICWDQNRNSAFVPCGHMVSCSMCAHHIVGKTCPICRMPVRSALRIFT